MQSEIIHGDCLEGMKNYPDNYFTLSVCDPPYGINAGNGTGRSIRIAIERGKIKGGKWDLKTPTIEYFNELFRISQYQIIWGGNYFPLPPTKSFIIWDKAESMYGRDFAECEFAWVTPDKPAKIYKKTPNQLDRIHPTQKPIDLYKWIYKNYLPNGGKVLDSHGGSCSNVIAALETGNIEITCFEIDEDYYKAAKKRIETHFDQLNIFREKPIIIFK